MAPLVAKTTGDGPAKPPSPVQIRAAPPNSLRSSREWAVPASAGDSYCSKKPSNRSSVRRATLCKPLHRDKCQRAISQGRRFKGPLPSSAEPAAIRRTAAEIDDGRSAQGCWPSDEEVHGLR